MVSYPCVANLLIFGEAVMRTMGLGHAVDVLYLDFGRAFDSANHRFLLAKMKSFGLGDVVVRWIQAHLSRRGSRVHVGGGL